MMTKKKDEHKHIPKDNSITDLPMDSGTEQGNSQDVPLGNEVSSECIDKQKDLEDKIAELTANLSFSNDKYLRLSAEFDNFRKRTLKEKMDLMKNASESVMVSFLPVLDDVERAMHAIEISDNLETTKEGIGLIYNKFKDFTKQQGVVEMEANGLELNTDHHEAITKIPVSADASKGKIVDVVQKGYLLNDKVIRFAKVVIGE